MIEEARKETNFPLQNIRELMPMVAKRYPKIASKLGEDKRAWQGLLAAIDILDCSKNPNRPISDLNEAAGKIKAMAGEDFEIDILLGFGHFNLVGSRDVADFRTL